MKALPIVAAIIGVAAMAVLVGYFGAGAVWHSLEAIGWAGFAAICAIHLGLIAVMGLAWRVLLPGVHPLKPIWARLMRDSGAEALPLSQVGGYVLGARALSLFGVSAPLSAASTIVDVTLEFFAQLLYTALGLALLVRLEPETRAAAPVLIGLLVAGVAAAGFVLVQRHGFAVLDRIAGELGRGWAERTAASAAKLHAALDGIYRRPLRLWLSSTLHLLCWIVSASEVWIALRLAGEPLSIAAVLAIESLLYAIRTVAFLVPQSVGVQEGAYILLGASFGLTPDMALALSLMKRGRDLAIGLPAIAAWQAIESHRLFRPRHRPGVTKPVSDPPSGG
ncbi:MAG TPA: lysylphosphatidylglycerol synthase domain-containing protein [Stellaceae bacterium]|nr:lysylphosphatidylglycerol synthase domain-containing protein [Stellaceae bacterium]